MMMYWREGSLENSFMTHEMPKFIFVNFKTNSYDPNSNTGKTLKPLLLKKFSTNIREFDFFSKKFSGISIKYSKLIGFFVIFLNFSPQTKIS